MKRVVTFIFHNWPLKIAAIGLATVLYAGLVLSQNASVWTGQVAIEVLHQPTNAVILGTLPPVTNIRYFADSPDAAASVTSDTFRANVDLTGTTVQAGVPYVTKRVTVTSTDDRIHILDFSPQQITIRLDPLIHRTVSVQVDQGTVPAGLQVGAPVLDVTQVDAFGPESVVSLVYVAAARVRIDASGLDVDQSVDLVALDARNNVLDGVEFNPRSVHVKIQVGTQLSTRSLPVNPVVTGTPAAGFQVTSISVQPVAESIQGEADVLAALAKVDTKPVSVSGANADVTTSVGLNLPSNVTSLSGAQVSVTVHIQPVTGTLDINAGLVLTGARSNLTYSVQASSVLVTLGGTQAALGAVNAGAFTASLDVSSLTVGTHLVSAQVTVPAGLSLVAISPVQVTVVVTAAPTPGASPSAGP